VVIDLVGFRKFGHNELDQPMFTQPLMYSVVKGMQPVRELYRKQLLEEGIEEATLNEIDTRTWGTLEEAYKKSKTVTY
jgi:2-oxoglutarate dehydrogenase E1 component